jgi:E3 ubiquitin-protein ligase MARCH6
MDMSNSSHNPAMSSFPDLMNDPAFDEREKGLEDMDTCRICHGEATDEEPLFYPCKCSGSIKFVHQSCLVEWLAHSQKKHCELCKTPFRFTKLYDPNMPQSLPTPLFIRQAVIQCFRTLVTWMRFLLVAFVWLGWLPWSMRAIWRALFWLADGRWSASGAAQQQAMQSAQEGATQWTGNGTTSRAILGSMTSTVSNAMKSAASTAPSPQSSAINFPAGDPLMLTLIKKVIPDLFFPAFSSATGQNGMSSNGTTGVTKTRYPSWLSDVKFLNSLTRYPTINNMIIDMLEGQLITLLVVIAFILLFLIREWVVQQQPMANIAEGEREAAVQLIANNGINEQANRANEVDEQVHWLDQHADRLNEDDAPHREARLRQASEERGNAHLPHHVPPRSSTHSPAPSWTDSDDGLPVLDRPAATPDILAIDHLPRNAEIEFGRPTVQDGELPPRTGVLAFRDVLARSNGDRNEMLRIIQEEGHEEELGWIVNAFSGTNEDENVAGPSHHAGQLQTANSQQPTNSYNEQHDAIAQLPENQQPPSTRHPRDDTAPTNTQDDEPPKRATERLADWFWGDITPAEHDPAEGALEDDAQIVQDPALEDPFVPVQPRLEEQPADGVMAAAAAEAGVDPNDMDAIEGDDFEGIMDLIGMQGPIFGLLQNAVFCALLIAFTVAIGIWLPYLWGKIALVLLANPLELIVGVPMAAVTVAADIALDTLIGVVGYVMYWVTFVCKVVLSPFGAFVPAIEWIPRGKSVTSASLSLIDASTNRLNKVVKAFLVFHESDIPMFSVISHQALKLHQARIMTVFQFAFDTVKFILHDFPLRLITLGLPGAFTFDLDLSLLQKTISQAQQQLSGLIKTPLFSSGSKLVDAGAAEAAKATISVDYDLAVWDTKDRAVAILMGYILATTVGFLYLRITGLLSGAHRGQRVEGIVAEVLLQAGGVMKVILIIGIEMIVFPLYCGTLLDIALLPLFSNATVISRIAFTTASPLTSLFVHWFIGTCYMFHFALFVSMCRKILRSGVLCEYFI